MTPSTNIYSSDQ